MIRVELKSGDGLAGGRPWLRSLVRCFQEGLVAAGRLGGADGRFGTETKNAVKAHQRECGLPETGLADRPTWDSLRHHLAGAYAERQRAVGAGALRGFRGDLGFIHDMEGHRGCAYWPGGASGVTLDPGVDLGFADAARLAWYRHLLTPAQLRELEGVLGLRGAEAEAALVARPALRSVAITRAQAAALMPRVCRAYWEGVLGRFPVLGCARTPASVQTALLSLAYNRGARNRGLARLALPLAARRWEEAARRIGRMQQAHPLAGVRRRRRAEACLIRAEIAFLGASP